MGKFKWILICGVCLLAFGTNAVAAEGSDAQVFFQEDDTPEFSATLAALVTSIPVEQTAGTRTAISISNTLSVPALDGVEFGGFPGGSNTVGAVWAFCYNSLTGENYIYKSSDSPVGSGLVDGELEPGGTWLVFADEFLAEVGFDPAVDNFAGYCYFVGEFDAIVGTYVNVLSSVNSQQAFPMQADFGGVPIDVTLQ